LAAKRHAARGSRGEMDLSISVGCWRDAHSSRTHGVRNAASFWMRICGLWPAQARVATFGRPRREIVLCVGESVHSLAVRLVQHSCEGGGPQTMTIGYKSANYRSQLVIIM
jgi:hypothetical protein